MISFCKKGTSSAGTSTPRSPRATMIPADALMIASMSSTPSMFSILVITPTCMLCAPIISLISSTASALRMNDAAMKSIPFSRPNSISALSFSVIDGKLTLTLGTLTPLRLPKSPPLITSHTISVPSLISLTFNSINPSSIRIVFPASTSCGSSAYVMLVISLFPLMSLVVSVYS